MIENTSKKPKTAIRMAIEHIAVLIFWLLVWGIASYSVGEELLLPSPLTVLQKMGEMIVTPTFWKITATSLARIIVGILSALAIGAVLAFFLAVDLNVLPLGEESAAGLGLHVGRVRFLSILATALLAGAAVSFSGLLSFVGLLVPHMARRLVGGDNRWLLPVSTLLGGSFVLLCDVLARLLFAPFELPVGIVMSLLGGPFFLHLLMRRKRSRVYD